jgi:hypothetical protein
MAKIELDLAEEDYMMLIASLEDAAEHSTIAFGHVLKIRDQVRKAWKNRRPQVGPCTATSNAGCPGCPHVENSEEPAMMPDFFGYPPSK